ncbi:hypothetical protein ACTHGU_11550 [Chitinophagaceae bacterium MMS25-I14]
MNSQLIPENIKGKNTDFKHVVTFENEHAAGDCFRRASKRLLNPSLWHELVGALSASFTLTGEDGEPVRRLARENDHISIIIPGPGDAAGGGEDWVKIELIDNEIKEGAATESIGMRLRACADPRHSGGATAHFFTDTATSTFLITREGNKVTVGYFGRNEVPNTETGHIGNNLRNAIVAAGAFIGLSELQWNGLIKAFLQPEIGG